MLNLSQLRPLGRWLLGALAVAIAAAALTVTGASGADSENSDGAGSEVAAPPDPEAFNDFRACMKEQGVDVPKPPARRKRGADRGALGPPPPPRPHPNAKTRKAFEACADRLPDRPDGAPFPGPPPGPGALKACKEESGQD